MIEPKIRIRMAVERKIQKMSEEPVPGRMFIRIFVPVVFRPNGDALGHEGKCREKKKHSRRKQRMIQETKRRALRDLCRKQRNRQNDTAEHRDKRPKHFDETIH